MDADGFICIQGLYIVRTVNPAQLWLNIGICHAFSMHGKHDSSSQILITIQPHLLQYPEGHPDNK